MDEKELQEIKERAEQVKRLLGHGSYVQNLIENDVPKLVAEVEDFKASKSTGRAIFSHSKRNSQLVLQRWRSV